MTGETMTGETMTADEKDLSTSQGTPNKKASPEPGSKAQPRPEPEKPAPPTSADDGGESTASDPSRQPS